MLSGKRVRELSNVAAAAQAQSIARTFSDGATFFAFLEKADLLEDGTYVLSFELITDNDFFSNILQSKNPQISMGLPIYTYTLENVTTTQIYSWFDPQMSAIELPRTADNIAEGSWFHMCLVPSASEVEMPAGTIVDIQAFIKNPTPISEDAPLYSVSGALLRYLPILGVNAKTYNYMVAYQATPPSLEPDCLNQLKIAMNLAINANINKQGRTVPTVYLRRIKPVKKNSGEQGKLDAPLANNQIDSIGIMDIGIGNCNMLISNDQPICYFDVGFPKPEYIYSVPGNLLPPQPPAAAPTAVSPAGPVSSGVFIILSHWDWDHWYLGQLVPALATLQWIVPDMLQSAKSIAFANMHAANIFMISGHIPAGIITYSGLPNKMCIIKCKPNSANKSWIMNNSGLSVIIEDVPFSGGTTGHVVLTADANFDSLPMLLPTSADPIRNNIIGILAAHHGSSNNGAINNLPAPNQKSAAGIAGCAGRIAYSYGMYSDNKIVPPAFAWKHPYNFPTVAAVTAYQTAGWPSSPPVPLSYQNSTVEGTSLNQTPAPTAIPPAPGSQPPARGNIRMGQQTALQATYNTTAFYAISHSIT